METASGSATGVAGAAGEGTVGFGAAPEPADHPEDARELSEEDVISLLKDTFDAEEVEEH